MGRFYRTANPQFLDFAYEVPKQELMRAAQLASDNIEQQEEANDSLRGLLKLDANDPDREYADQILSGYEKEIDKLAKEIQQNPLEYRRKSSKISDLERRITNDFTRGDAAMIQSQFDTRAANLQAMKEAFEKNPDSFDYADINKMQALLDRNYSEQGGFKGGAYSTDRLREYVDLNDYDKLGKDFEADIIERFGAFKGKDGFLYTSESKDERVDPQQIFDYISNAMMNDDRLNGYLSQQVQLGNITQDEYINRLTTTASGIANKYGYNQQSSGLKSIKRDNMDVARQQYLWDNPVTPTVTGKIKYFSLLDRYRNNGRPGDTRPQDTYSIEGVNGILNTINEGKDSIENDIATQVANTGFIENEEDFAAYQNGDFSVLSKYGIDESQINQWQSSYDTLIRDEKIANATIENALNFEGGADAYFEQRKIAENTDGKQSTIGTINVVDPTYGMDSKQKADYIASLKGFRQGFGNENTPAAWKSGKMYYNPEIIEDVAQSFDNPQDQIKARQMLKEGASVNDLINSGLIQRKQTKIGEEATYMTLSNGTQVPTGTTDQLGNTNVYSNFRINGNGATPTNQTDAEGRYLTMVPLEINGISIEAYADEARFHSQPLRQLRNQPLIQATDTYNQYRTNGVDQFEIGKFEFYNENGMKAKGPSFNSEGEYEGIKVMTPQEALNNQAIISRL